MIILLIFHVKYSTNVGHTDDLLNHIRDMTSADLKTHSGDMTWMNFTSYTYLQDM